MSSFELRVSKVTDLSTLVEFNQMMAFETEQKKLDEATLTKGVAALLEDNSKGFYLVAEQAGKVVASLMVTTEWSDWRNSTFWWIQSVYVIPEARRQGLYSALYNQVKKLAKEQQVCGFRLYVEKENKVAQKTYESLGMSESHYLMFEE